MPLRREDAKIPCVLAAKKVNHINWSGNLYSNFLAKMGADSSICSWTNLRIMVTISEREETIGRAIVNAAFQVHQTLGPGLLERIYEVCLAHVLRSQGLSVERQVDVSITFDEMVFDEGLRLDLLVEGLVIVEIKAVESVNPVWQAQVLSHLKLTKLHLGYLLNFNVPLAKDGIRRFVM